MVGNEGLAATGNDQLLFQLVNLHILLLEQFLHFLDGLWLLLLLLFLQFPLQIFDVVVILA